MQGASSLLVAVPRNREFLISPAVDIVQQGSTAGEGEEAPAEEAPADPGPAAADAAAAAAAEPAATAAEPAAAGSKPPAKPAPAGRCRSNTGKQ
jgi:hypothetical protein